MAAFDRTFKTQVVGGPATFYTNYEATNLYVEIVFDKAINILNVSNDSSTDTVQISYDGATLDGELYAEENIQLNVNNKESVFIKATTGGDKVRIWGY